MGYSILHLGISALQFQENIVGRFSSFKNQGASGYQEADFIVCINGKGNKEFVRNCAHLIHLYQKHFSSVMDSLENTPMGVLRWMEFVRNCGHSQ